MKKGQNDILSAFPVEVKWYSIVKAKIIFWLFCRIHHYTRKYALRSHQSINFFMIITNHNLLDSKLLICFPIKTPTNISYKRILRVIGYLPAITIHGGSSSIIENESVRCRTMSFCIVIGLTYTWLLSLAWARYCLLQQGHSS